MTLKYSRACMVGIMAIPMIPCTQHAQTRAFVVRLGADTFAVERIVRHADTVQGAVARHTPTTTVLRYTLVFNGNGSIASYEEGIFNPDGAPTAPSSDGVSQTGMKMTFVGDSVIREVTQNGARVSRRNAVQGVTLPVVAGMSPYAQEIAVQAAMRQKATGFSTYSFALGQNAPNTFDVRVIGTDSAELMFAQGFRRGYRFDRQGHLLHGDASNTTVRLQMTPTVDADVDAIARAWGAKEARGEGMGMPSTRDSVVAIIGDARVSIDYGRPAKRGRVIWGKLVPFDTVWRLGANSPTRLTTDKALQLGNTTIPAGSYSVWLVPSAGQSYLLVNRQIQGWVGVPMHDPAQDVAKIPVRKHSGPPAGEERFRILVDKGVLMMLWDDGGFDVSIQSKPDGKKNAPEPWALKYIDLRIGIDPIAQVLKGPRVS